MKKKINAFTNFKKCWNYCKQEKKYFVLSIVFSTIMAVVSVISPILYAKLVIAITDTIYEQIIEIALFMLLFGLLNHLMKYLWSLFVDKYYYSIVLNLNLELIKETMKVETSEINKNSTGVFIDRIKDDTPKIANIFLNIGENFLDILSNVGILFSVLIINRLLFFYFLITRLIIFGLERLRLREWYKSEKTRRKLREKNTGLYTEIVRGSNDIKVLNIEKEFLNKTKVEIENDRNLSMQMNNVRRKYRIIINDTKELFEFLFVIIGALLIFRESISASIFLVIYMYRDNISSLLNNIVDLIEKVKEFNLSANRIFEVIDGNTFKKEQFGNKVLKKSEGNFEFKNVCFSYNNKNHVLKDVSFKVDANTTVAIVGKSGSGKTTILNLIERLYIPNSGEILIDGYNINDLSKDSIRNNISIITQNPYLFNFSIRENLKVVKPNLSDKEMIEVCKMACLHDFIMTLPEKYDTIIGEGGITLSGGQKQRLAIARALIKKTEIILFDEATSALDNETQAEIQLAINNIKKEYTIIIVAHRLSTIINSDKIIVLNNGIVEDIGTHKELLKNCKLYNKLYENENIDE